MCALTRGGFHKSTRKYGTVGNDARSHAKAHSCEERRGNKSLNVELREAVRGSAPMLDEARRITPSRVKSRAGTSQNSETSGGVRRFSDPCRDKLRHATTLVVAGESCEDKSCDEVDVVVETTITMCTAKDTNKLAAQKDVWGRQCKQRVDRVGLNYANTKDDMEKLVGMNTTSGTGDVNCAD